MFYARVKELMRFSIAGVVIGSIDFGVYFLLIHFVTPSIAKGISFICAGIFGYYLNKYWTLKQKRPSFSEAVRYVLTNCLALGINVFTNQIVLNACPGNYLLALIIASMVTGIFSYFGFKYWVFRDSPVKAYL